MMRAVGGNAIDVGAFERVFVAATFLRDSGADEADVLALISERLPAVVVSPSEFERIKKTAVMISAGPALEDDGETSPSGRPN